MFKGFVCLMLVLSYFRKYSTVGSFLRTFHVARNSISHPNRVVGSNTLPVSRYFSTQNDPLPGIIPRKRSVKVRLPSISEIGEEVARAELTYLDSELRRHNELYFEKNSPEISDAAYDKLVSRAEALVGKFRHLGSLVPSLDTVGMGKSSKFAPFPHASPMLSLSKAFNTEELTSFMNRVDKAVLDSGTPLRQEFVLEPKIDGLSLGIIYEYQKDSKGGKWCMTGAGTRGDGDVGENVTENVRKYLNGTIPEFLSPEQMQSLLKKDLRCRPVPGMKIEVRGEVFISRSDFQTLNEQRAVITANATSANAKAKDAQLATARNAAAGALRKINPTSSTPEATAQKYLQFYAYSLFVYVHDGPKEEVYDIVEEQTDTLRALSSLGFKVAEPWTLCASSISGPFADDSQHADSLRTAVLSTCAAWESQRHQWDFDADGAVLKVSNVRLQRSLGATSRCPKWAIAYKFAADKVLTSLREIEVRVGRTGVLTPVARVEPVKVGGVMVESATLHNENEINRLKLKVGDNVWLKRAGDVIPKILGVERRLLSEDAKSEPFRLPTTCPECGSPTERVYSDLGTKSNLAEGDIAAAEEPLVSVRCTGGAAVCPAQAIEQISHFASKDATCIDGLGRSRVEDLFEGGIVKSILDLYELRSRDLNYSAVNTTSATSTDTDSPSHVPSLRGRKGWGDRSVNHLLAAIDQARLLDDYRFLFGLGVRYIGVENARLAVAEFGGFPALWTYLLEESDKLKAAGLQYHILPRQRAVRKTKKNLTTDSALSTNDDNSTATTTPTGLFLHECAPRLQAIDGLGPKAVQSLLEFAAHPRSIALVEGLLQHVQFISQQFSSVGDISQPQSVQVLDKIDDKVRSADGLVSAHTNLTNNSVPSAVLAGRVAVFTGKLESGMSRDAAEALFESFGGEVRSSINKSVNLLVQAGDARASNKYKKAMELGIEVWSEDEWSAFIKRHKLNGF